MEQGDAISRSAVLDAMPKDTELLRHQVVDVICNTPALDVVPAEQDKWISVKDRLPQRWKRVLVAAGDFAVDVYEAYIDSKGEWMRFNSPIRADIGCPTYWIPLPEPPKEGNDEQHHDGL